MEGRIGTGGCDDADLPKIGRESNSGPALDAGVLQFVQRQVGDDPLQLGLLDLL